MKVYVRSENNKNIIILNGDRESFRIRQRNKNINGERYKSLKFISYKEMKKDIRKRNKKLVGPIDFETRSKM
tara:strand:+ start:421 stop:636 length:216 start_codon:yes stop_codon:yes gene_type:complete